MEHLLVSASERERRYSRLRDGMAESGCEALLICARDDGAGSERGRFHYVTDLNFLGGRCFALVPRVGDPILFQPGHVGRAWAETVDWVKDVRVDLDQVDAVVAAINELGLAKARIGLIGGGDIIAVDDLNKLHACLPAVDFADATPWFDRIKAIKSQEEIGYVEETCEVFRRAFSAVEAVLRPGMTERAIAAEALRIMKALGGTTGFLNIARSGGKTPFHPPTDDVIESTDCVGLDLQYRGPHGYAAELTRYYSFAEPAPDLARAFEAQQHVFDECVRAIRPGVESDTLLETMRQAYADNGFELAGPIGWGPVHMHLHGIGLDFTEPPIVPDLNLEFAEGMVLTLHPRLGPENPRFPELTVQDNLLVQADETVSMCFPRPTWTVLR